MILFVHSTISIFIVAEQLLITCKSKFLNSHNRVSDFSKLLATSHRLK